MPSKGETFYYFIHVRVQTNGLLAGRHINIRCRSNKNRLITAICSRKHQLTLNSALINATVRPSHVYSCSSFVFFLLLIFQNGKLLSWAANWMKISSENISKIYNFHYHPETKNSFNAKRLRAERWVKWGINNWWRRKSENLMCSLMFACVFMNVWHSGVGAYNHYELSV